MSRVIEIIATETGKHYLLVGLDQDSLSSFKWQLYLTKYGERAVDWLQNMSIRYMSFMGGDLFLHNSDNVDRCNFFGEQKNCYLGIVANEVPQEVKVMDSLIIDSDGEWQVESITIPASLNYPNGMYSTMPTNKFKRREGVLKADFPRNMKTSSSTAKAIEAVTGEPLRGEEAYMVLKNTDTDRVKVVKIVVNMTSSKN